MAPPRRVITVAMDIPRLLLPEHSTDAFFGAYWGTRWVRSRGPAARFAEVFSPEQLGANALGDLTRVAAPSASYRASYDDAGGVAKVFGAPLEMAEHLLAAGMTLQFTELEQTHPSLAQLAAAVGGFCGARGPVTVNCFVSPDGHGFPWHLDNPHVFALQIE